MIAQLPAEDDSAQRSLAQSFLVAPRYVGHQREIELLTSGIQAAIQGTGWALRVEAPNGAGRSRLLEESAIRAELAGAAVVRADASANRGRYGVTRALALSLIEALPRLARQQAREAALTVLGPDITARLGEQRASDPPEPLDQRPFFSREALAPAARRNSHGEAMQGLEGWFLDVSRERPLVVLVDNVEYADDASLGTLLALARATRNEHLFLVILWAERVVTATTLESIFA